MSTFRHRLRSFVRLATFGLAAALAMAVTATAQAAPPSRAPQLPAGCEALQVPQGHVVTLHVYAIGVQTYRWNSTTQSWTFTGPQALLYPAHHCFLPIGVHYAGPTWSVPGGGTVVGSAFANHVVDPTAIPWLLLSATATGPGVLSGTTFVQRLNTAGGRAPTWSGVAEQMVAVPYTAEYWFYRAL